MKPAVFLLFWFWMVQAAAAQLPNGHRTIGRGDEEFDLAALPQDTHTKLARLHVGMTRAEVEKDFDSDGGIFWGQRYFLPGLSIHHKGVVLELTFQPMSMPDEIYTDQNKNHVGQWWHDHPSASIPQPADVLRDIGKPFLASPTID